MKRKIILTLILAAIAVCACALAACATELTPATDSFYNVKIVFELEGGTYKNSTNAVTHYYHLDEGQSVKIKDPNSISGREISLPRPHTYIGGWCRTKTEQGEYGDEWDFNTAIDLTSLEKDPADGKATLTLYANWLDEINYSFGVYVYNEKDEDGNEIRLGGTEYLTKGDKFDVSKVPNYCNRYAGHTFYRFVDADGKPLTETLIHPGHPDGVEQDYEVKIYAEYILGEWKLVSTKEDIIGTRATADRYSVYSNLLAGESLYLLDDIDLEGITIRGFARFGKYSGNVQGNGHKISNFTLASDVRSNDDLLKNDTEWGNNVAAISLFGIMEGSTIDNVVIENMQLVVGKGTDGSANVTPNAAAIYVAPLAVRATDCTITNVTLSGSLTIASDSLDIDKLNVAEEGDLCYKAEGTTQNGNKVTFPQTSNLDAASAEIEIHVINSRKKEEKD